MKNLVQNGKSAIVWLCSAHLVCDVYGGFLNPLMPFIASKLGFTIEENTKKIALAKPLLACFFLSVHFLLKCQVSLPFHLE